jgi:hypothetical protein
MPITLDKRQYVTIAVILFVILPLTVSLAFRDRISDAHLREIVGPKLQREFGFEAGIEPVFEAKQFLDVFVIQSVNPTGILGKAGFRAGDIPMGYKHGFETGFYQDLLWVKEGDQIEISVVNLAEARVGNWSERKITLQSQNQK